MLTIGDYQQPPYTTPQLYAAGESILQVSSHLGWARGTGRQLVAALSAQHPWHVNS